MPIVPCVFFAFIITLKIGKGVSSNVVPKTHEVLDVQKGNVKVSDGIYCNEQIISVEKSIFISTHNSTTSLVQKDGVDDVEDVILWEVQGVLNFKNFVNETFNLDSIKDRSGKLKIVYKCVNITTECTDCVVDGTTCLSSIKGSECKCLQVPDKTWSYTFCSGAKYKGCYKVQQDKASPHQHLNLSLLLTPQACIQACQMLGYQFAILKGLKSGCFCVRNINATEAEDESKCASPCHYNPLYSCGKILYGHVYETNVVPDNSSCANAQICPNGTTCLSTFDSYSCLCNGKGDQPLNCYGCFQGWMSMPGLNSCYAVVNFSKSFEEHAEKCKLIYGEAIDLSRLNSLKMLMFFFRIIVETFMKNSYSDMVKSIIAITKRPYNIHQLGSVVPICQREKRSVIGKFPWALWPSGTYGLPMPLTGCPKAFNFSWQTGFYRQDTEDVKNENNRTIDSHLLGNVNNRYIEQSYCIKSTFTKSNSFWPDGKYCIYKKGECPPNMLSGEIFWDDEDSNNTNKVEGVLPDGMFKADTKINFCCMITGDPTHPIVLPRDKPFFLFPFGSAACQSVVGTSVHLEHIQYDLENDYGNVGGQVAFKNFHPFAKISEAKSHLILYYCYYNPIPSCGAPLSSGHAEFDVKDFSVGRVLKYKCGKGYENVGDHQDVCLSSETWSSLKGPECIDIDECKVGHACHVKANCYNTRGSFSCKCNPGWHGDGKYCEITLCKDPHKIANGEIVMTDNSLNLPGLSVISRCDNGYVMLGCNSTYCLPSGEWEDFPTCRDAASYCVPGTYHCVKKRTKILIPKIQSVSSQKVDMCCSCQQKTRNETIVSNDDDTWRRTVIIIVCALAGLIIVVVLAVFVILKLNLRKNNASRESMQSNGSIYADINEIKLDFKIDKRKGSSTSNTTNSTELKFTSSPPHPPPRSSVTESLSTSSRKSSLFVPPDRMNFRRRSDFGSTDLHLVPPKQFSTIFQPDHFIKNPRRDEGTPSLTQFKLNSMTKSQRRYSEFKHPAYLGAQSNAYCHPSLSMLSRLDKCATPIAESENESDDEESPYIDVTGSFIETESLAENTDHYRQVPKRPVSIGLRHRSVTVGQEVSGLETARQTYQAALFGDLHRSHSLPVFVTASGSNSSDEVDADNDDVFFSDDPDKEKREKLQQKRKSGASKISLKVKLTSFSHRHNNEKNEKRKVSFCDLSSRLAKYKITFSKNSSAKRRGRSDTNPF